MRNDRLTSNSLKVQKYRETDRVLGDYQQQINDLGTRISQLEGDEGPIVTVPTSIDYDYDPVNITNSTADTIVFSGLVSSLYQVMKIEVPFKLLNNSGGTRTLTVTVEVNNNVLFSAATGTFGSNSSPRTGICILYIRAITTGTQWINAGIEISAATAEGSWGTSTSGAGLRGYDTGAIDMSADSTVEVLFTLSAAADPNYNLDTFGAHAEVKL